MKSSLIRPITVALVSLLVGAVLGMWLNRPVSRPDEAGSPAAGLRQWDGRINAFWSRSGASAPSTAPASIRWASLSDDDYLKYLTELKRIGCPVRTLKDIIEGDVEDLYRPQLAAASGPYWSHSVLADRFQGWLRLAEIPETLTAAGVDPAKIPLLAEEASRQWTATFNPRPITAPDFERLYREAL